MFEKFDYVVVGAGFAGLVVAERIATQLDKRVLIIEKRNHIGGNAYDMYDDNGILIHKYGPHIFHTNNKKVWDYLSCFTEWHLYHHRVLGEILGYRVPIPFNLNSLSTLFPAEQAAYLENTLIETFGYNVKIPILKMRESGDEKVRQLAEFIYEQVFLNYTAKQWGTTPDKLNSFVTSRVPVSVSRDNRYFQNKYQGLPKGGYSKMFDRMTAHPNVKILLNTNYKEVVEIDLEESKVNVFGVPFGGKLIYTGKIDELFDYVLGQLPYRSLKFEFETLAAERYQEVGTVNYPNEYDFTRITEFKHLTGQTSDHTTIVKEYPQEYVSDVPGKDVPYYPIPTDETAQLYRQYRQRANLLPNIILLGRLAEYTYYDMDAVVAKALKVFEDNIRGRVL